MFPKQTTWCSSNEIVDKTTATVIGASLRAYHWSYPRPGTCIETQKGQEVRQVCELTYHFTYCDVSCAFCSWRQESWYLSTHKYHRSGRLLVDVVGNHEQRISIHELQPSLAIGLEPIITNARDTSSGGRGVSLGGSVLPDKGNILKVRPRLRWCD